ncbi:hypothetical protein AUR64_03525 [Haloprofundus marisrubri]|uniref:MucB/RseB N-terminal domain-containing protein n=1 Tax=Haloprofundus marisrubri TaxID=1514971 RepID=A0A0W1RDR1_9EURY|nr:sigma-E factor regulatory protein RseB domain-containing protein [Haloprofundus marisrubri]KTG11580.1 hypothetical protein AUR64_03525 [Haloprofundus marisrubri]
MTRLLSRFNQRTLLVFLLLAVALPIAFLGSGGVLEDSSPSVDANVTERYRAVDTLTGTQTVLIRTNGTVTSENAATVTLVPGSDKKRVRFHDAGTRQYDLQVSNGSTLWLHDTEENAIDAIQLSNSPAESRTGARLQRLFVAAELADQAGRPQSIGVSPLPVLPRHTGIAPQVDANRSYTVDFVEIDSVGGREAYVLDVVPTDEVSRNRYEQRLWVDTERLYPLRKQTAWTDNGTQRSVTTTYTNVTFDTPISTDTFQPERNADTSVQRPNVPNTEWYRSRADLKAQSSLSVPDPTIPSEFELVYATQTTGRIDGVGLRYAADGRQLTVAKFNRTIGIDSDQRDVTIDGQPAAFDYGPTTSLSWDCNGYGYSVRGTDLEPDRLVEIGQSVGCNT